MKTTMNIKTDVALKKEAQKPSKSLGLSLSTVVNHFLSEFVAERRIVFSEHLEPNTKTAKLLKTALADVKEGKNLSPAFENAQDAMDYLNK